MQNPKVAIVQDYMHEKGGSLRVVEAIHEIFPEATVFTATYAPSALEGSENWKVKTSDLQKHPLFKFFGKQFTPLYPIIFESFDLSEFDIVISSTTAWAKGVITKPEQLHICYCHTPPRFLYKYSREADKSNTWYYKPFVSVIETKLRVWDFIAAQRPDFFIANSETVKKRIQKFYRRDSVVIYPPVNISEKLILNENISKFDTNYYLTVARLSKYKNIDLIIEAFNATNMPLRIVGKGKELEKLKKLAKGNIAFLTDVNDTDIKTLYENCKGFIYATKDEDFGIVVAEALNHGKPVLSHRSGGPTEIIVEGKTGMFFDEVTSQNLTEKLIEFDKAIDTKQFDTEEIRKSVVRFGKERFKEEFKSFVTQKWEEKISQKS